MRYLFLFFLLTAALPAWSDGVPSPPPLAAKAYLLRDFGSNTILAQQNAHERIEPASLTKLMTAYLVFKALKNGHLTPQQVLPVSPRAWKAGSGCGGSASSCMFIAPDKPVTVDELLHGMIIQSGNDASIALAEGIAGTEAAFAELMNQEAARLGMKNTHFTNASGLPDPAHYSTVYDLSLLAAALIRDFPQQYQHFYKIKQYTYNNITQMNRNRLLWLDPYVDGMKTGHTAAAGYCLIASAKRGDMRLISVLVGAPSDNVRITDSQRLLNYGFQFYEDKIVYRPGQTVSTLRVWKGRDETLDATVEGDVVLTYPKGQYGRIKAIMSSVQPLIAPIAKGQVVGTVQFSLDGKVLLERKLVASREVAVAGIFGRLWDGLKLRLQ
ncbi:MAG: D-alanyl-D-alanine carboxypeptidase [Methylophilaceae bacterium]|nr:D-alanyl-D-alanine carboxypeptidase [Methylophilaceae bacterium]